MSAAPSRRVFDEHYHPDMWSKAEQHRYEDRTGRELGEIRDELAKLRGQITMMLGAIGLVVFLLPVIAPFIRSLLNLGP